MAAALLRERKARLALALIRIIESELTAALMFADEEERRAGRAT